MDGPLATENARFLRAVIDSLRDPVLVADLDHTIVFMNRAAVSHYSKGEALLGTDLLDCHNSRSNEVILEVLEALRAGEEERLITDNAKHRIYMRAVRDADGTLIGYYERYEPPASADGGGA